MRLTLTIEHDDDRHYAVEFEFDDPEIFSDRLASTITDVQKRFIRPKARGLASAKKVTAAIPPTTAGGAK
jgi:hypothetical protein